MVELFTIILITCFFFLIHRVNFHVVTYMVYSFHVDFKVAVYIDNSQLGMLSRLLPCGLTCLKGTGIINDRFPFPCCVCRPTESVPGGCCMFC